MSTPLAMPHPVYGQYPDSFLPSKSSLSTFDVSSSKGYSAEDIRRISRTPSPTPSEYNALHGNKPPKSTKQKIKYAAIASVVITIGILFSVFNKKIVNALSPATDWLRNHKFGPAIPIAILFIISFPPLFGQELIATLVGVTWSLPESLAIVAVGTLLGEIANYFVFKYACTGRSGKLEAKNFDYGLMAYVVRRGGFLVVLVIRYSTVPSHFATALFASVGISFWIFLIAAILSLPQGLLPVYIGYVMQPSVSEDNTSKTIENIVTVAGILITVFAYVWLKRQTKAATPDFIHERQKARQADVQAKLHSISRPLDTV
ncbi:hypothetical protein DFH07DRAFT_97183 [Mycena maculata]|uniref:Golgi apparatus membrane protein TVP38 n=1 Tax=Mycena maculata TaxID=230809 RepID=A0AAD7I999_9AGAR|nr:hypothetical protein DFH07DRAFT_97183 [Mycena maculata]